MSVSQNGSTDGELAPVPKVAWLGELPAAELVMALMDVADLHKGWCSDADLLLVWAPSGPAELAAIDAAVELPRTIATGPHEPDETERRAWRNAGVDDYVSTSAVVETVRAALDELQGAQELPLGTALEEVAPPDPTALVLPSGIEPPAPATATPPAKPRPPVHPTPSTAPPSSPEGDLFPPLPVPQGEDGIDAAVPNTVQAMSRYLERRAQWIDPLGPDGLKHLMSLCHLRDRVSPATAGTPHRDAFGLVRGAPTQSLEWPVILRHAKALDDGQAIESAAGRIVTIGCDGLLLDLDFQVAPRQRLIVDLAVDEATNAQLLLEARWQRRLGLKRWHVGALIWEMRLRELG